MVGTELSGSVKEDSPLCNVINTRIDDYGFSDLSYVSFRASCEKFECDCCTHCCAEGCLNGEKRKSTCL